MSLETLLLVITAPGGFKLQVSKTFFGSSPNLLASGVCGVISCSHLETFSYPVKQAIAYNWV